MSDLTPMMRQYARIKENHRDAILFFRLGDFYEMFREDAQDASRLLGLTLTSRQKVPMCGVPYHAAKTYIARLLRAGRKVAVCEQVKLPGGKGLAEREVIEVVTPGTITEDDYLDATRNNYLLSAAEYSAQFCLAYIDLSTGELGVASAPIDDAVPTIRRHLARLQPKEILLQESLLEVAGVGRAINESDALINGYPDWMFDVASSHRRLEQVLGVRNLKAFGIDSESPLPFAAGALLDYVDQTAGNLLAHVQTLSVDRDTDYVGLDESTIRNLELVANLQDGSRRYTLIETVDFTRTAMGARTLRQWLLSPLRSPEEIRARQVQVEVLYRNQEHLSHARSVLNTILDLERITGRLAMEKAHPKDLVALAASLRAAIELRDYFKGRDSPALDYVDSFGEKETAAAAQVVALCDRALLEEPSVLLTEGGIIRRGYDAELDRLHQLRDDSRGILEEYVASERAATGIGSLKVRYNRVIGHYLEVTKSNVAKVPEHFIPRQSLANSERFTTERLGVIESDLNEAAERIVELEREIFLRLRSEVATETSTLLKIAALLARLDVFQSLAHAATVHGYTAPRISSGETLSIAAGRHPVVEAHAPSGAFVPNGIELDTDGEFFALITGPNMAGKSTYLRQTALIVLLAQIGSFVPADDATIGVVDRIFCRVGASDNLARGESTFLVEMNEAAFILRTATSASLVIMDEIGRGTSTNDGMAIAQAVIEYMVTRARARTLFATHFHELTAIELPGIVNLSLQVEDSGGEIVFLKRVASGPSSNAYGIHVARLAGVPQEVLLRAEELLKQITAAKESGPILSAAEADAGADAGSREERPATASSRSSQGGLFEPEELILRELRAIDPNHITPIDALQRIARWADELDSDRDR
jgi:DNA mismatch repair protein MutS